MSACDPTQQSRYRFMASFSFRGNYLFPLRAGPISLTFPCTMVCEGACGIHDGSVSASRLRAAYVPTYILLHWFAQHCIQSERARISTSACKLYLAQPSAGKRASFYPVVLVCTTEEKNGHGINLRCFSSSR